MDSRFDANLLMLQITYLPMKDVVNLCSVNKRYHNICYNPSQKYDHQWKKIINNTYSTVIEPEVLNTMPYNYLTYTQLINELDRSTQLMIYYKQGDLESFNKSNENNRINLLTKAFEQQDQKLIEFLIINYDTPIQSVIGFNILKKILPNYNTRRCQGSYQVLPIPPGSDDFWENMGYKILKFKGYSLICKNKNMSPFLKSGNLSCCRSF